MLADPNDESPANVDAAVSSPSIALDAFKTCFFVPQKEWRESYSEFKRKVARCVRKSQEEC